MRAVFAAALCLLLGVLGACSGPSIPGLAGATPQSVAVQNGDVPTGLQKCSESGEINSYLKNVKAKNTSTYQQVNDLWQKEKKAGATAGWVQAYADSSAECNSLGTGQSPSSNNPPRIVLNYVVQFKDESSAAKDYNDNEILGVNPQQIQSQGGTVKKGSETGLGGNSTSGSISLFGLQLEFAAWQKKAFFVAVIAVGLSDPEAKKVYDGINGRIH
jgi:hypothetical protein